MKFDLVGDTPALVSADADEILHALHDILPADCILSAPEQLHAYESDGLTLYRQTPRVVVLAETETQIQAVLRMARRLNVPVVTRGAGTGLSGGALPHAQGILLVTSRMNRILDIDPVAATARVQPGVRNLAVSDAARAYGLFYAPDPSSQIACSIGGNVAENSGGVHCLKYGLTLHNVMQVRLVTLDGEILTLGSEAPDAAGPDLLSLAVGSEGMLGVVTEVLLRLLPMPDTARVIMASFADVETAGQAVADIMGSGIVPAGLEMMDGQATRMVEPFVNAGYDTDAAAILLCESDGTALEVEEEVSRLQSILQAAGASRMEVSQTEAQRELFWKGRKNAFPAAGRISPDYYCMDGTIPRHQLARVLGAIADMEQTFGLACANVFHAGDGNLHPLILFDSSDEDQIRRANAFGAAILELCVAVGGTITGEHGVGIEKIDQMCVQFGRDELDVFLSVKRSFDPDGLLNPDKVIPTLARCAEYGKMHVHHGNIAFPDLPRF